MGSLEELGRYPWCGHAAILGRVRREWQDTTSVLRRFGRTAAQGRRSYCRFLAEGGSYPTLDRHAMQGVLIREGGEWRFNGRLGVTKPGMVDRLVGRGDFVKLALRAEAHREERKSQLLRLGWTPARIAASAARMFRLPTDRVYGPGKAQAQVKARSLACKWMVDDLRLSGAQAAHHLRISPSTVSQRLLCGRRLSSRLGVRLEQIESWTRIC